MLAEIQAAAAAGETTLLTSIIALVALTAMEIVLGIDNIVFISVVTARLPLDQQARARYIGLGLAMGMRILLLLALTAIMRLTGAAFELPTVGWGLFDNWITAQEEIRVVTWKDLIMLGGGLFLIRSSVVEIHDKVEGHHDEHAAPKSATMRSVLFQICLLDLIFSLDSVITAVGMARDIWVMITAVVIAVGVMMAFAGTVAGFVEKHPTVKMLALAFLLLIGVMLVADGVGTHIEKGYIYFAMGFAILVEVLNLRVKARAKAKANRPA